MKKVAISAFIVTGIVSCAQNNQVSKRNVPTPAAKDSQDSAASSKQNQAGTAGKIPTFELTWLPVKETVTAYHVYYNSDGTNVDGTEVNSLLPSSPDFKTPKITIKLPELVSSTKSKACFYVIAENEGAQSPASNPVCL